MKVTIFPGKLHGEFYAPASKSAAHRALICAALSNGISRISHVGMSEDAKATMGGLCAFGARISHQGEMVEIEGIQTPSSEKILVDCGESGSTLRFLIPIAACLGIPAVFNGRGRLPERTLQPFVETFKGKGIEVAYTGRLPFEIRGKLRPGEYSISGDISSQFISGLLFGLPLLSEDSRIRLTTPLSSAPYVDMTIHMLRNFGVEIQSLPDGYFVPSVGLYTSGNFAVEGDYSGAAFYLAAGALFGNITCAGLDKSTRQGDREILSILERFGGKVEWGHCGVTVCRQRLCGIEIDADAIPDLVPILAVAGAFARGETRIVNASRLRFKGKRPADSHGTRAF